MPANENSLVNPSVKELIAIGAAIACNCEMCFKFHFDKARKLGISDEDMLAAVETGAMVKNASAQSIKDLAYKYLNKQETKECQSTVKACCS
jgi:AhpD family alkylhydroperoxidase